jgi:hypothetical protein
MQEHSPKTPHAKIAVAFASALVKGDYAAAHALLTPVLGRVLSAERLREELFAMFSGYSEGKPERIWFDEADNGITETWPGKSPGDVCWAYVGIEGENFLEAVSLLIQEEAGKLAIGDIIWGRP